MILGVVASESVVVGLEGLLRAEKRPPYLVGELEGLMMLSKLTMKQEKFAQGLFSGLSQREAYKQAYDAENMTDKTIDEAACRLADDSKVSARIIELQDELKYRNMATTERVLSEYAKIGFADIKDFLAFRTEKTVDGYDDEGKPIYCYKQIVDAKPSEEIDGSLINEVSIGKDGTFRFKLHDKKAALDMIGKHLGMFTDKVEFTGANGGPIELTNVSNLSDDDLRKVIDIMEKGQILISE